jgi:hypothetical protein
VQAEDNAKIFLGFVEAQPIFAIGKDSHYL